MNCDFASQSIRRRKKESRFGFSEYLETQKGIAVGLHGVSGDEKMNCDWASWSIWKRKKESQLGFTGRRGNPKGIAIHMQCVS